MTPEIIPVLFRVRFGEVTAVFPTLPWTKDEMTCYVHVGQHGGCSLGWYNLTRRATPTQYAELLSELKGIYESEGDCVLEVRQRISPKMRQAAKRNLK